MRTIKLIFMLLLAALLTPLASHAAQGGGTTVRAILVIASKEKGGTDPKLRAYEGILRANLRYESFRFVGESSATVPPGGKANLNLQGKRLQLQSEGGGAVFVRVVDGPGNPVSPGGPGTVFNVG